MKRKNVAWANEKIPDYLLFFGKICKKWTKISFLSGEMMLFPIDTRKSYAMVNTKQSALHFN